MNPPHPERGCAESLAGTRGDHHPLPPLSVGELPATRSTHHRWDHLHPLLRVLPTNRRQEARPSRDQLQQEEASRWEEGNKRKTPEEEPPKIGLRPSSTAPRRRPNSPRTTDPNRQGTGPIHSVVRSRETASTDDPFKTTEFTSQAYDPLVDEALADAHIPSHATRIHTTASHLLPRFPSPIDAPGPDRSVQ